jgi:hypothetical protein
MTKIKSFIGFAVAILAGVLIMGCAGIPKTSITGTIAGHPFTVTSPKDVTGLDISLDTNGAAHLHLDSSKNNPDVITAVGTANQNIAAIYEGAFIAGITAAGNAYNHYQSSQVVTQIVYVQTPVPTNAP